MKKRLLSLLLALSMMLALVPAGAFAASSGSTTEITVADLKISNGVPNPDNTSGTGWEYNSSSKTLTILKDFSLDLESTELDCAQVSVVNNGVIKGGTFKLGYNYNVEFTNKGVIEGGKFIPGSGSGMAVRNSAGSKITGGFFGPGINVSHPNNSGNTDEYTITGGVFLTEPRYYSKATSSPCTTVKIGSDPSVEGYYSGGSYKLDGLLSDNLSCSSDKIYIFGSQSVTVIKPTGYEVDSRWGSDGPVIDKWLWSDSYDGSKQDTQDSSCPVTVTTEPMSFEQYNPNPLSYRKITISTAGVTQSNTVYLYPYAYKTKLTIGSNGLPDTTDIFKANDGHYYGINPSIMSYLNYDYFSSSCNWEYDETSDPKVLKLNHSLDITGLSPDVQVEVKGSAEITGSSIQSPITINSKSTLDGTFSGPVTVNAEATLKGTYSGDVTIGNTTNNDATRVYGTIAANSTATFTGKVTCSGAIAGGTFDSTSAVNLSDSGKITGGLFLGTVNLTGSASAENITGGIFANIGRVTQTLHPLRYTGQQ